MYTRNEILTRLQRIVAEHLSIREEEIAPQCTWAVLEADSLDRLDLSLAIEDEFKVDIPHLVGERLDTVGETADYLWWLTATKDRCSNICIEAAATSQHWAEMASVRNRVFTTEYGFKFNPLPGPGDPKVWHFLARDDKEAMGTLSVVDTTSDRDIHERYGLKFSENDRVARYAQLAILAPYRKRGVSRMLIETARNTVIRPNGFSYAWLLYPAAHVHSSILTQTLGFTAEVPVLRTEFGRCRVLVRKESNSTSTRRAPLASGAECWERQIMSPHGALHSSFRHTSVTS